MKSILIILLALFSSCLTVKRIEKNCDKFAKICVTETAIETIIRDTTIYIKDTVFLTLPKDTVVITKKVKIIEGKAQMSPIHKEFGYIGMDAGVIDSKLWGKAYFLDPEIIFPRVDTVTITKYIVKESKKEVVQLPPEKYIPGFYNFTFWFFIGAVLLIGGYVFIKFSSIIGFIKGLK
jgi:hypothetical protein